MVMKISRLAVGHPSTEDPTFQAIALAQSVLTAKRPLDQVDPRYRGWVVQIVEILKQGRQEFDALWGEEKVPQTKWTAKRSGRFGKQWIWEVYLDGKKVDNSLGDDAASAIERTKKIRPELLQA